MRKIIFIILILLSSTSWVEAQSLSKLDSLNRQLQIEENNSKKIEILIHISEEYWYEDSKKAEEYALKAIELAEELSDEKILSLSYRNLGTIYDVQGDFQEALINYRKSLLIEEAINNASGISACYNNIGIIYEYQGEYDSALIFYNKALEIDFELEDSLGISICLNNIGGIYDCLGIYVKAIEFYSRSLDINIKLKDNEGIAINYNNIGEIYRLQGIYSKAIDFYEKSLAINQMLDDKSGESVCYNNIGTVHHHMGDLTKAISYYQKSLLLDIELNDTYGQAVCLNNIGEIQVQIGKYDEAFKNISKSLEISNVLGDSSGIAKSFSLFGGLHIKEKNYFDAVTQLKEALKIHINLGEDANIVKDYIALGKTYLKLGHFKNAERHSLEALNLAQKIGTREGIKQAYKVLWQCKESQGDYYAALDYHKLYKESYDSVFTLENKKQLSNLESKFELERKMQKIELQKSILEKQEAKIQQQKIRSIALIIGFGLVSVIIVLILFGYRRLKNANIVIIEQKEEILEANEELSEINDELRTTMEVISQQKEEITDSIHYAKYIQNAILPQQDKRDELLGDHFVFYNPRNIVSGDFYWTTEVEGRVIIAAADCTGHGVPGAFMSMLGHSFLNDIVTKEYINHPGVILRRLRKEVINALQQKGKYGEQHDGMDIALCSINFDEMHLQFAGANNPLYIIRSDDKEAPGNFECQLKWGDSVLYELKGDKMTIAHDGKTDRFKTREVNLLKGDCLYMFSDGYPDQFGGTKGKKFMYKQFKEMLLTSSYKSMNEQRKIIAHTIESWMGNREQVDDMLIIGLRII